MNDYPVRMTTKLRKEMEKGIVVAASCYDSLSARIAEHVGFDAIHLTGFGFEVSQLGAPDLGVMTMSELAAGASRMASAIHIPILCDIDTGFGSFVNIARTIKEMEKSGVAGVHMEDQASPKKCPVAGATKVVSRQEAADRIKAACDARTDADFVIVGRSDADTFDEVIERCNLYLQAGADIAMPVLVNVDGISYYDRTPDEQMELLRRAAKAIDGPVMGQGTAPPKGYTFKDMEEAGFVFTMFAGETMGVVANALEGLFAAIKADGCADKYVESHPGKYYNGHTLMQLCHLDQYAELEKTHFEIK